MRLLWALPLVLLTGAGIVLLLRRTLGSHQIGSKGRERMSLRESVSVSQDTRIHLLQVDRQSYLLVESSRVTSLQATLKVPVR